MKQKNVQKCLRLRRRKRMQAMVMATALAFSGINPMTVLAEESIAEVKAEEENEEEENEEASSEVESENEEASSEEESENEEVSSEEESENEEVSSEVESENEEASSEVESENETSTETETTELKSIRVERVALAAEMVHSPVGLLVDSPEDNVLTVVYGPSSTEGVVRYVIYLDGEAIKEDAAVAFYTFEDIEAGEHKIQVTAVLEDGTESEKSGCEAMVNVKGEVEGGNTENKPAEDMQQGEWINLELATTTLWCGGNDGWAEAFAEIEENGDEAVITASNFGNQDANEWAIQYKIEGIEVTEGTEYILSCELLSDVDKEITLKLHDEGEGVVFEKVALKAGEKYSFEKMAKAMPANQTQLILALGKQGGDALNQSGTITISKIALTEAEPEEKPVEKPVEPSWDVIAISESKESATCGEDVILTFYENEAFSEAITKVLVNGTEVSFDKDSDSIEIDGSYFTSAGVYDIEVKADGYTTANVYQQVFEDDVWELVFADEFNGNSLDTNIWTYQNGTGAEYGLNGWGNDEEQYYTSDNLSVGDGTLTIEAKKESIGGKTYTSSRIRSLAEENQGFSTTYGRVEAKIKMPAGDGIWPAFWMLPSSDIYGTWASNGEIDIMEARGRLTNQVLGTIHYGETWPNNKSAGVTYELPNNGSITDYHTYTLEWDVGRLTWYVDGVETKTITNWYSKGSGNAENYAYPAPFDAPFHIVFNMALGGTFDGGLRPADSLFAQPVEMDVDYVRVYRNNTEGYYDKEVEAPKQETDAESFEALAEKYADEEGNFIEDTDYVNVEKAAGVVSTDMKNNWARHWYFLLGDFQGAATYSTNEVDGDTYATFDITNGGTQNYAVQLIQHLPLVKGYTYEISFDAFASKSRDMIVKMAGDDDNGWGAYSNAFTTSLKTKPQHYTYTFTMSGETDETARLEFNMGLDTGKISIANVCVKVAEVSDNTNAAKEPLEDGNHIYNGTFDQGTGKLAFWNLDKEAKEAGSAVNSNRELEWKAGSLEQQGIQLLQSDKYQFMIHAAGEGETISISLQNKTGDKEYAKKQYTLSNEMESYDFTFEMPEAVTDKEAVLHMETTGSIQLDNVVMKRLTDNNVSYDDVKIYPLSNGDFEDGMNGWTEYTDGGAACATAPTIEQDGSNHYIAVHGAKGGQAYFNMLIHEGVELKKGTKYDISFKAKATSEQSIEVKIENASYTSTLAESFAVGTDWKDYSFTFKSGLEGTTALKYLLAGVNAATTVYLDDIVIKVSGVESKIAPVLSTKGSVKQGKDVVVTYGDDTAWETAAMRVFISDEEIERKLYIVDTEENTITIKAEAFAEAGMYAIKVIAEGYDYTQVSQTIISTVVSEDGNIAPEFSEWEHYVGSDWAYVSSSIINQKENNIELSVKANGGWADTAWGVQLVKADIPVTIGYPYTVSFKAESGQDKKFAFKAEDANGKEIFYKEYSLKAGEEQTITVKLDEMTTEFVKLYLALGVFADETNINTPVSISDFEMCNALTDGGEEPEEPETPEEPEVPETPDVTKLSGWTSYYGYDWAWVTGDVVDKQDNNIALTVKAGGGWDGSQWGVQLTGNEYPVTAGEAYTITFKAKSDQDKKIAFKVGQLDDAEIFMQEYNLKAGEEQTITIELDEMPVEKVKLIFALGLFADETNIDTTITLSDFEMNSEEEEAETSTPGTDNNQNQSNSSDDDEDSNQNDTGSTTSATVNKVVRVEDKLANVIFDSEVPLANTPEAETAKENYDISLYGTDGILTVADLMKLKHRSMILNAFLSNRMGITINPNNFVQGMADLNLSVESDTTIDYGEGFSSVTFVPKKPVKLDYDVTIHLGIGAEHAGKVAYLFVKDMTTGELVRKQATVINNIGNIAYTTKEYSFMVVLY